MMTIKQQKFSSLIYPEPDCFTYCITQVYGLTIDDVQDAPIFLLVWEQIEPIMDGLPLVAHNSPFD